MVSYLVKIVNGSHFEFFVTDPKLFHEARKLDYYEDDVRIYYGGAIPIRPTNESMASFVKGDTTTLLGYIRNMFKNAETESEDESGNTDTEKLSSDSSEDSDTEKLFSESDD